MTYQLSLPGVTPGEITTRRASGAQVEILRGSARAGFMQAAFGPWFIRGEGLVFSHMQAFCAEYSGGQWGFIKTSKACLYMRPPAPLNGRYEVRVQSNGFDGQLSADAVGIVVTLYALNTLVWQGAEALVDPYHALREFGIDHAESSGILGAID
jgi:hypothetical protein